MINGYTTEQKRRHTLDMRENYQRILASFKATGYDEGFIVGFAESYTKHLTEAGIVDKAEVDRLVTEKLIAKGFSAMEINDALSPQAEEDEVPQ